MLSLGTVRLPGDSIGVPNLYPILFVLRSSACHQCQVFACDYDAFGMLWIC